MKRSERNQQQNISIKENNFPYDSENSSADNNSDKYVSFTDFQTQSDLLFKNNKKNQIISEIEHYDNGSSYIGAMKEGRRDGFGILTLPQNVKYCGEWLDDCLNGVFHKFSCDELLVLHGYAFKDEIVELFLTEEQISQGWISYTCNIRTGSNHQLKMIYTGNVVTGTKTAHGNGKL